MFIRAQHLWREGGKQDWAEGETELRCRLDKDLTNLGQSTMGQVLLGRVFCFRPQRLCLYYSLLKHGKQAVPEMAWTEAEANPAWDDGWKMPWWSQSPSWAADPALKGRWQWGHICSYLAHRTSYKSREKPNLNTLHLMLIFHWMWGLKCLYRLSRLITLFSSTF